jgi:hypothetical protein
MELEVINTSVVKDKSVYLAEPSEKIKILVDALRLVSSDQDIKIRELIIPDECEKYGFIEGKYNLSLFLQFIADMLEE